MIVKLVSLNIWNGGVLMEEVLNFLEDEDADIILLQEVYDGTDQRLPIRYRSLETLLNRLPYPHHSFAADYLEKHPSGAVARRGNAILSKPPIRKRDALFFNKSYSETYVGGPNNAEDCPRNIQYALVDMQDHDVHVFNIHGVWDLDGNRFSQARQLMGQAMINVVKGKKKVVLAGDTNALPTNQAIQNIKPHLRSVFDDSLKTSFNIKRKNHPGYASSVVDMVFTDYDTKVISKGCPEIDISDHLPLVVTLDFN